MVLAVALAGMATASVGFAAHTGTVHNVPADQAAARTAILHLSDFASGYGWKQVHPPASTGTGTGSGSGSRCSTDGADFVQTGHAASTFAVPGFFIHSEASVMQTAGMVRDDWHRTVGPALLACFRNAIATGFGRRSKIVSVAPFAFPQITAHTKAYRVVVDYTLPSGGAVRFNCDAVLIGHGRTELTLLQAAPSGADAVVKSAEIRMATMLVARMRA